MKTMHILTVLTLYAMLLPGCRSTETPAVIVPRGTPSAGDPARLIDCELQHKDSETNFAAACSKLVTLLDQEVKQQNILGMVMAERLADGTVIWATSGYTGPSGKERWSATTPSLGGVVVEVAGQKAIDLYHRLLCHFYLCRHLAFQPPRVLSTWWNE